jgi:hypothetical protein
MLSPPALLDACRTHLGILVTATELAEVRNKLRALIG